MVTSSHRGNDTQPHPMPGPRPRHIAVEQMPPSAHVAMGSADPDVLAIAVQIHNDVVHPATGELWREGDIATAARVAFTRALSEAQEDAANASLHCALKYRDVVTAAGNEGDHAADTIETVEQILDETIKDPSTAQTTKRQLIIDYQAAKERAKQREPDGDVRHTQHALEWLAIVIGAIVSALLDVLLLWVPVLNLGAVYSAGDLLRWCTALAFVSGQALCTERVLHHYRERERESTDRRDAIRDYNRDLRANMAQGQSIVTHRAAPDVDDLKVADSKLRIAHYWLTGVALINAVIAAVRVAILVREAGLSFAEAGFFGAAVGLLLGFLVQVMGWLVCRGNQLGDRLRAGADRIATIDAEHQNGITHVAERRDCARRQLATAVAAKAEGEAIRATIVGTYWSGMLLAA